MENLTSLKNFIPHGYCLSWSPLLLKLHVVSDLFISLAYFSIPITLMFFMVKRKVFVFRWLIGLFAAFIVSCGITHLLSLITIWYPIYWIDALFKIITAVLSIITAVLMVKIIPKAMALPLALQEKQHQNKHILNNMHQGIVLMDSHHKIIYCNPASQKLTGYQSKEIHGKSCEIFHGPDTDQDQVNQLWAVMEQQQHFHGELLNYRKDGSVFWNDLQMTPIRNSQGEINQYLCIQTDVTERKQKELQVILSEQNFQDLANSSPSMIYLVGIDKKPTWFNAAWLRFTGHKLDQETYNVWESNIHPEDFMRYTDVFHTHFDQRLPFQIEYRMQTSTQEYRWIACNCVPRFNSDGAFKGYVCYANDITDAKNSAVANDFFNSSYEIIYSTDLDGFILEVNDRFLQVSGYNREELIGRHIRIIKSGVHDSKYYRAMWQSLLSQGFWCGEVTNRSKKGNFFSVVSTVTTIRDEQQNPIRYLAIASDISSVIEKRRQMEQLAYYDNLTGLPNRLLLKDRLAQNMARVHREGGCLAVVFIDLDGFKAINDSFGHFIGDEFLIAISQHIKQSLRETDTVVRIGGDEFVVILADLTNEESVKIPIQNLLEACQTPININQLSLTVSASMGYSLYKGGADAGETDIDELIRQADKAMYVIKQSGKNGVHRYDEQIDTLNNTRTETLKNIESGLAHDEFILYYQPKVNLHTGELIGVEALIRWQHPARGLLHPKDFLLLLDNHPLGIELGYWVLNTALSQIDAWQRQGLNIAVSINIDARQLYQQDFLSKVRTALAQYPHFLKNSLEFEILESIALHEREYSYSVIEACKEMGVKFSLDDFGTGYSSLTYLRHLPIDTIKIDRSFVESLDNNSNDYSIVKNVIGLVNNIGHNTLAEGIETEEQGKILLDMGCEFGQGFVIAKPMPAEDIAVWKNTWQLPDSWKTTK